MCYLQLNVYNYLQIFFTVCVLSKLTVFEIFLKNMINHSAQITSFWLFMGYGGLIKCQFED